MLLLYRSLFNYVRLEHHVIIPSLRRLDLYERHVPDVQPLTTIVYLFIYLVARGLADTTRQASGSLI